MSSPSQGSVNAMMPSFLAAAARVPAGQAAAVTAVNKDSIRRFITRSQPKHHVAHVLEQAIQRGLIDHRASEDGWSVACVGEAQAFKPVGPAIVTVSCEATLTAPRLVVVGCRYVWFTHRAPQAFPPTNDALRRWTGRCLQADLMAAGTTAAAVRGWRPARTAWPTQRRR